jgi:hypothetical protein
MRTSRPSAPLMSGISRSEISSTMVGFSLPRSSHGAEVSV